MFEIVCHFSVTQESALSACEGYQDSTAIPPVGSHVAIKGTFVQDNRHAQWNEIHPVTSIMIDSAGSEVPHHRD